MSPARKKTTKRTTKKTARKPAGKKTGAKSSSRKSSKRTTAKKTARKTTKKAARKSTKRPAAKKSTKKTSKKPARQTAKKSTRKSAKQAAGKKSVSKNSARSSKKTTRKSSAPKAPARKPQAKKASRRPPAVKPHKFDRKTLERIREQLRSELEGLERQQAELEDSSDVSQSDLAGELGTDEDYADAGTATFDRERDFSIRNNISDLIGQVTRALEKIDEGTYGNCEHCGRPINAARLQALPHALLCMDCKRRDERSR